MKHSTSAKKNQAGVGLLEALIAVVLSSIVILGAVYSTSRMLASQQQNNLQYIIINELSSKLQMATTEQKADWCAGNSKPTITLPKENAATDITVNCGTVDIKVVGNTSNPTYQTTFTEQQPISFDIQVPTLGGKITVGESL
ncbi:prepilin-type N-terminal cleavage/methylation domain-containing protein [Psychrobacter sp. B38]|uniref:prepilin-type N-terminal cleavage/methylation domain-containing protein n=1 Tax=Psychrobacter sp. B38 TaxID=3143538 RepID=UPI0032117047